MSLARTLRTLGSAVLAGALVIGSASAAAADQARDSQWPLEAFKGQAIWNISTGKGVTVAVIDAGVDAQHVDLTGNVVIQGKDFMDGGAPTPDAELSHGTQMASIIAGHGHGPGGADGVMGLAPDAKVLNIRDDGQRVGNYAASIRYAVDRGASVINISQGGAEAADTESVQAAIAYALRRDVLVVAPTGNDGGSVEYPANYPGVLAVGGVKNNGEIWDKSNSGPSVLLAAPATNIVGAGGDTHTSYRSGTGTSDATAFVSAAAALLRAKYPDLTAGQIANRLVKTAGLPASAKGISLPDERYGYGFIRPLAALTKDIPAGSEYGPLSVPESLKAKERTAPGQADDTESSSSTAKIKRIGILAGVGIVGLLIVGLLIFLIVRLARR